jgi:AcrR family transcriptional regulator
MMEIFNKGKMYTLRKKKIVQKAMDLFLRKVYEKTTIKDVTQTVGIEGPGFYHYFKNKEDLLAQVLESTIEIFQKNVVENVREIHDPEEMLKAMTREVVKLIARKKEISIIMDDTLLKGATKKATDVYKKPFDFVRDTIQKIEKTKRKKSINPTVAAFCLIGMTVWIYKWYNPKGKISTEELADYIIQIFFHGFLKG